jgi:serine O-acetyltransferase
MDEKFNLENGREVEGIVNSILADYEKGRTIDNMEDFFDQPEKEIIIDIVDKMMRIIYPGYYRDKAYKSYNINNHMSMLIEDVMYHLNKQIVKVSEFCAHCSNACQKRIDKDPYQITVKFLQQIPKIREYLEDDLKAALEGDPAANSLSEIILAYPGLFAITVNRMAHELYLLSVPLIPRIMTEYAHSVTGIDIHPGASIGRHFFIDHGTGIVIGETTVIGDNVKIYQGVTLGALSTRGGQKLKNVKRHPTIEDNVTIYAGASILGGDTVIGKNSVIGSNAFITKSIPAETTVSIKTQELQYKQFGEFKEFTELHELEQDEYWFYQI